MSKKVDRWLTYGQKRCAKGDHWYILEYPDYFVCPICGRTEIKDVVAPFGMVPEYNGYIVREPEWANVIAGGYK